MFKFRGKVKKLTLDTVSSTPIYKVSFEYCDKVKVQDTEYGVASNVENQTCKLKPLKEKEFTAGTEIFNFISHHKKEVLIISFEDSEIKKVEVDYE